MAIKVIQPDGSIRWKCSYCNKVYPQSSQADDCRDKNHDLVYIQMSRSDVDRLLKFLYMPQEELITETMVKSLRRALKNANVS